MKLTINPKRLFRSKKSPKISRSGPSSVSSSSSDSSNHGKSDRTAKSCITPKSILPELKVSGECSDLYSELVHAFKFIDRNGDGKISRAKLEAILSRIGRSKPQSDEELGFMVEEIDRDGDGYISLEEFGAIGAAFNSAYHDFELRETFDFFDTDHDGMITAEELRNVFDSFGDEQCTLEDCRRMIAGVDENGDGVVCFDEFTRMMEGR